MREKQLCIAVALSVALLTLSTAAVLAVNSRGVAPPSGAADEGASPPDALQQGVTPAPLTFVDATTGAPMSLDPHWQYDTASHRVVQQVYEPLIFYDREKTDEFVPMLAVTLPQVSPDATVYTFTVRQGVQFHEGGDLTPSDVAYSFWRWMLQDRSAGPGWLILEPMLGVSRIDDYPGDDGQRCRAVKDAVTFDNDDWTVTFHLNTAFDPILQILAGPWSSALDKEWMAANGGWGGDCSNWRDYHNPAVEDSILWNQMNGTGPFMLSSWISDDVALVRNDGYRRTEPIWPGGPSGLARLQEVVFIYEPDWPTRLGMLASGEADSASVPRQNITEVNQLVRDEYDGGEIDPDKRTILNITGTLRSFKNLPSTYAADAFFVYDLNPDSPYIGSGNLDGLGIPTDFFTDTHVRKAFNYCFDWDTYIADTWAGEAEQRRGPIPRGVTGFDPAQEVYTHSLALCQSEFQQAWGGQVWTNGFSMTIAYNTGNDQRQAAAEVLKDNIESITDTFHISVIGLDWMPDFWTAIFNRDLPVHVNGMGEDYHHPYNWVVPYMRSNGMFAGPQRFPQEMQQAFDDKIDECSGLTGAQAELCYQELQAMAHDNAIDIFLVQPAGRHYEQLWVNGYYHNAAYPGSYLYPLSKSIVETITSEGGGSLVYTDTNGLTTTLEIPAGAVTDTVELRYTPLPEVPRLGSTGAFMGAGHYFELSALISGTNQPVTSLEVPYTIIVTYSDEDLSPVIVEETLALYYWDGTQWVQEPTSVLDTVNNTITAYPDHFSSWAALGETKQVFLPLVMRNY